jgi:hypothetical protein
VWSKSRNCGQTLLCSPSHWLNAFIDFYPKTYIKKFIEKDISRISHILLDKQKRFFYIFFNKSFDNLIRILYQNFNLQNKQKQNFIYSLKNKIFYLPNTYLILCNRIDISQNFRREFISRIVTLFFLLIFNRILTQIKIKFMNFL